MRRTALGVMVLVVLLVAGTAGCGQYQPPSKVQLQSWLQDGNACLSCLEGSRDEALAELARQKQRATTMPAGPQRDATLQQIAKLEELIPQHTVAIDKTARVIRDLQAGIRDANSLEDVIRTVGGTVGAAAPPPYGLWIGLGTSVLAGILTAFRAAKLKAAGQEIARTVEPVLTAEQKAKITGQGKLAETLVDQGTGKAGQLVPI